MADPTNEHAFTFDPVHAEHFPSEPK